MKAGREVKADVIVTEPLRLSSQELNALARVAEMAWNSLPDHSAPATKDMRSVWAAGRALAKIKNHLKGIK